MLTHLYLIGFLIGLISPLGPFYQFTKSLKTLKVNTVHNPQREMGLSKLMFRKKQPVWDIFSHNTLHLFKIVSERKG